VTGAAPEPLVSAIVLNWNGAGVVLAAVASLLAQTLEPIEVIVVDNASTDGSDAAVEERFAGRVALIRNSRNLGFGAGNNVGLRAARGRFVLLLNNDAEAAPTLLEEMVRAADGERIGMVAAKVLLHGTPGAIDTTGHLLYPDGLNRGRGRLEVDRGQYDRCRTALFPSGAAGLYRRRMLDEIGLFDEAFFLYGDDAELGLRGRRAGWECAFAPRAVALHHYSRSAGPYSALKAFHVERNRVWVLLKLFPWPLVWASPFYTGARLLWQAVGIASGRGAAARLAGEASVVALVGITLRAWWAALAGAPRVLAERRRLSPAFRLSTAGFFRLLDEFRLTAREVALKD
jgi:GT2 family glycosyltransferase